jgi:hypothetical protein
MKLRGLTDYDIVNYKKPVLFLAFPWCSFKCDKEFGTTICQNSELIKEPIAEVDASIILKIYTSNPLTKGVVCGGLEPIDSFDDLLSFIQAFRAISQDPIIIYTGYTEEEIATQINQLKTYGNLIVKYGRFVPNARERYDEILGVTLASDNQYAKYYE